jgi:hypothetical protein
MQVRSPAGQPIGKVKDIVPNTNGQPGYVLITTPSGADTAIPYAAVAPMIRNGSIVLDAHRLAGSPRVRDSDLQNRSDSRWRQLSDHYWKPQGSLQ